MDISGNLKWIKIFFLEFKLMIYVDDNKESHEFFCAQKERPKLIENYNLKNIKETNAR